MSRHVGYPDNSKLVILRLIHHAISVSFTCNLLRLSKTVTVTVYSLQVTGYSYRHRFTAYITSN